MNVEEIKILSIIAISLVTGGMLGDMNIPGL